MQRVSSFLPSWEKRNSGSTRKSGGLFGWSNRTSQPPNGLGKINTAAANSYIQRVQRETFWPATLDLECDKAARILKSFCVDGYLAPVDTDSPSSPTSSEPKTPVKIPKRIPKRIIQNAAGIAVFTCMRSGLWMTGSGGSGILIARKSDGTWSPPSGIMLHTPTLSFIIGVDVYDCVLVISNPAALEAITRSRVTLGEDVHLRSGESVPLDSDEMDVNWRDLGNSVQTYMKARGQHQHVNLGGCILTERSNENERFYHSDVTHMDILAGNVARHVDETTPLFEVIKMAEGRTDFDQTIINKVAAEPAPGDAIITTPNTPASPRPAFGLPKPDDPDPFGVLALEMAGLEIREAGSRLRPTSSLYDLNQSPMSPSFSKFSRQSMDTFASRSNRGSYMSSRTIKSQATDIGTQTDSGNTPETTPSPGPSDSNGRASPAYISSVREEDEEVDYTTIDTTPIRHFSQEYNNDAAVANSPESSDQVGTAATVRESPHDETLPTKDKQGNVEDEDEGEGDDGEDLEDADEDADEDDIDDDEEPVIFEVAAVQPARTQAVASRMIQARGNVVTIAKRVPPPLPKRSPARMSRINKVGMEELKSPLRQVSNEADLLNGDEERKSTDTEVVTEHRSDHADGLSQGEAEQPEAERHATRDTETASSNKVAGKDMAQSQETLLNEPQYEQAENSDSVFNKKHTSSIYTGVTEDRWSMDGSSVTTPTSEQRFSMIEDTTAEDTPKKTTKEAEKPNDHETFSPFSEVRHTPIAASH